MHPAIKELYKIVNSENNREEQLNQWLDTWTDRYYETLLLSDKDRISIDLLDAFKMNLTKQILLDFLEERVIIEEDRHRISAELLVFRKKANK